SAKSQRYPLHTGPRATTRVRESSMDLRYLRENTDVVWEKTLEHLSLSLTALAIALPLAIVLGVLATRLRWLTTPIVTAVSILYTIPSFAFMAFLIPEFGIGRQPAMIVLVTYA